MIALEAALGLGNEIIKRVWPDPAQQAQAQLELLKLQQSGELAQITGQMEINKVEAASSSLFVSGWRPAIGWVCAGALAYQYLLRPLGSFAARLYGVEVPDMPTLDAGLWELMFGMLGLGGLRTFEKVQKVAR